MLKCVGTSDFTIPWHAGAAHGLTKAPGDHIALMALGPLPPPGGLEPKPSNRESPSPYGGALGVLTSSLVSGLGEASAMPLGPRTGRIPWLGSGPTVLSMPR